MIDLHSHILAEVDDGSSSLEESLQILKKMEKRGVKKVAATPHYPLYNEVNYKNHIEEKLNSLRKKAAENDINVDILSGSEILIERDTAQKLHNNQLLTINNTDYLLLELRMNIYPDYFFELIYDIKAMGYQIVIAHPERYSFIQEDYEKLYKWVEDYELKLMFNSSSLLGRHCKKAKAAAEKLLELGLCHLMASDTHGINKRRFSLAKGLKKAEELKAGSSKVFKNNAQALIKNQKLENFEIKREEKSFLAKLFSF